MKTLNYLILVASLCFFSACGVSYAPLTAQRAPEISFKDSTTNVLVINRFDINKVDFVLRKGKKKEVFNRGINAEIGQLLNELESMKGIRLIKNSDNLTMARNLKGNLDSTVLTVGEIQALANKYNADYILALEYYDAGFVQDEVVRSKNDDGSVKKTAKYSLEIKSSWVLYDKAGQSFRELRGNVAKYHSDREVVSAILALGPTIAANTKLVQEVSIAAGKQVAGYFKSQMVTINRPLYADNVLKTSAVAIRNGDFVTAQKGLEELAKYEDVSVASKAYYNLAVLADLKGNSRVAKDYAQLSLQKKRNIYASMLLDGLK
jgi:hypothetical protein